MPSNGFWLNTLGKRRLFPIGMFNGSRHDIKSSMHFFVSFLKRIGTVRTFLPGTIKTENSASDFFSSSLKTARTSSYNCSLFGRLQKLKSSVLTNSPGRRLLNRSSSHITVLHKLSYTAALFPFVVCQTTSFVMFLQTS